MADTPGLPVRHVRFDGECRRVSGRSLDAKKTTRLTLSGHSTLCYTALGDGSGRRREVSRRVCRVGTLATAWLSAVHQISGHEFQPESAFLGVSPR
jgi:hypothetical protein